MDVKRAKEILSSSTMVNVMYEGTPIYIESVNDDDKTAKVHYLNQPTNHQTVDVTCLMEQ
jgi:small acid-soluble spore protein H (minor)